MYKRITLFKILFAFFVPFMLPNMCYAEDIYIAQTAQGNDTGADASNAHSIAWLNTSTNWVNPGTEGDGKVGPGDTVHLTGTISSGLYVKGSGVSGSPITILFDPGAKFSAPTWNDNSNIIRCLRHSYIVFDGGTNGIIEATDNGMDKTYQNAFNGIDITDSPYCEVKNLSIINLFTTQPGLIAKGSMGITVDYDNGETPSSHLSIHDNYIEWIASGIYWNFGSGGTDAKIYNNVIRNINTGVVFASRNSGSNFSGVEIYGNDIADGGAWDNENNTFHHDGIHIWNYGTDLTGLKIYNNYIHGNWGDRSHTTANVFLQGTITNYLIYNNVFAGPMMRYIYIKVAGPGFILNNTIYGDGLGQAFDSLTGDYVTFSNNIFYNTQGIGYNGNLSSFGPEVTHANNLSTDPKFVDASNGIFQLQTGSPAIDAGANESAYFTTDKDGTARPQGSAWDIGAYEYTESGGGEPHSPKTFTVGAVGCDYTSIQAVFDNNDLGPNDVIEVHEGVYHEQVVWGSDDDGDATGFVTLRAKPGDHVVITGDRSRDYCVRLVDRHYCKIEGIETIQALNGVSIYKGDHFLVWNCVSHDHDTTLGQYAVGIRAVGASYVDIRNCKVYDTAWNGIKIASEVDNGNSINFLVERCDVSAGHTSIDLKSSTNSALTDVTIRYNKIHGRAGIYSENRTGENVSDIKIYYNLFAECGGAHIATQTNPNDTSIPFTDWKIYNNTFDKCGTIVSNSHMEFLSGLTDSEIKNNIFSRANYANIDGQTRSLRFSNDVTGLELDHNCYYSLYSDSQTLINWNGTAYNTLADFQSATGQETHGFAQNPCFAPNYSLLSNSPCIDAGVKLPIHDTSWKDFAGNRTRYGTAPDIGCYEAKTWSLGAWGMLPWIGGRHKVQWTPYEE